MDKQIKHIQKENKVVIVSNRLDNVPSNHVFYIDGYEDGKFIVKNPWDMKIDRRFLLTPKELLNNINELYATKEFKKDVKSKGTSFTEQQ